MKHSIYLRSLISILLIFQLSSCKKDDKTPTETQSTLSAEQQKSNLDNEGTTFINDVKGLEDPELMKPMVYFSEIVRNMTEDQYRLSMTLSKEFVLSSKNISGNYLKSEMTNDIVSIKKIMTDKQGIYTYNKTRETWVKTTATGKIEFVFPSSDKGTSNDATFTISNLSTIALSNSELYGDNSSELPKTLNIEFKIGKDLKYAFYFTASYNSNNLPTNETVTLVLMPYKITEALRNNDKEVTVSTAISKADKTILSLDAQENGDFNYTTLSYDTTEPQDVFNTGNVTFQIENIKISGTLDFKTIAKGLKDLQADYNNEYNNETHQYPKQYYSDCAALFNANGKLKALFADKNEIFANLTTYATSEDDYYYHAYSDYGDYIIYKKYYLSYKTIFSDGSQVDASYFNTGFESFINNLNQLIQSINFDYDTDISQIDK